MSVCYTVSSVDSEKEQARRFFKERFPVYGVNVGLKRRTSAYLYGSGNFWATDADRWRGVDGQLLHFSSRLRQYRKEKEHETN